MGYRAVLWNDSHGTNTYYLFSLQLYNVGKYAIVRVLMRSVAVKRLMSVCSMAGTALMVYAAGRASAGVAWHNCSHPLLWREEAHRMLGVAVPRLVERTVKLTDHTVEQLVHAGQCGWSVERCCWALDVLSVMFTYWWRIDEWMNAGYQPTNQRSNWGRRLAFCIAIPALMALLAQ
jgi:hypothetical protein